MSTTAAGEFHLHQEIILDGVGEEGSTMQRSLALGSLKSERVMRRHHSLEAALRGKASSEIASCWKAEK